MNRIIFSLLLFISIHAFADDTSLKLAEEIKIKQYFDCPCPHLIAHRGASGSFPDSSLLAFQKALDLETDILELDVHLSADKKIIVSHDESLLRTTGKDLLIAESKLKDIVQADAGFTFKSKSGDFPFRNQGISTLSLNALIKAFPNARFNIEIKPNSPKLAEALSNFIRKNNLSERVVVASKHALALETFRNTEQPRAMTSSHLNDIVWAYIYWFFNSDMRDTPYELLQLPYQLVNKSVVDYFHSQNKKVHVWTVNDPDAIREMLIIGVDGVMTDHPEIAYPIFVELGLR
jgi:glycerophosphoryl diester phosphodiesterase